jgi:hypothetical protein
MATETTGAAFERLSNLLLSQKTLLQDARDKLAAEKHQLALYEEELENAILDCDHKLEKQCERKINKQHERIRSKQKRVDTFQRYNGNPTKLVIEAAQRVLDENAAHLKSVNAEWKKRVQKLADLFDAYLAEVARMRHLEELSESLQNQRMYAYELMPRGNEFKFSPGVEEKTFIGTRKGPVFSTLKINRVIETYRRGKVFNG